MKKLLLLSLLSLSFVGSANVISSPEDLYTTTCTEQSLEGLQRAGDNWESAERPLRTFIVTKLKGFDRCTNSYYGVRTKDYRYNEGCYAIADNEYPKYPDDFVCLEDWSVESNELTKITCQIGLSTFVFNPNGWFHRAQFHGQIDNWYGIDNLETYRKDFLTVSVGQCSQL